MAADHGVEARLEFLEARVQQLERAAQLNAAAHADDSPRSDAAAQGAEPDRAGSGRARRASDVRLAPPESTRSESTPPARIEESEIFWALNGLRARTEAPGEGGAVMMVGAVTLPDGSPVQWQQQADATGLLSAPWTQAASALSALGHPVRLEILRHLLHGVHSTADLADLDGMGTTGQLHHHLRDLIATGWVTQLSRGHYAVPATRIVPLLVMLTGVMP